MNYQILGQMTVSSPFLCIESDFTSLNVIDRVGMVLGLERGYFLNEFED